jgi:tRNA(fMet)-specific endonuclease VapC
MTLLLDTCTVIDVIREGRPHFRQRLREAVEAGTRIVISSPVLHELMYGAMISAKPDVELALIDGFVERTHVEPWSAEDALVAARVRADLKKLGAPIGAMDVLIGGQALNRGWKVVTANVRDFLRVGPLTVIDWSDPSGVRELDQASWRLAAFRNLKDPK